MKVQRNVVYLVPIPSNPWKRETFIEGQPLVQLYLYLSLYATFIRPGSKNEKQSDHPAWVITLGAVLIEGVMVKRLVKRPALPLYCFQDLFETLEIVVDVPPQ